MVRCGRRGWEEGQGQKRAHKKKTWVIRERARPKHRANISELPRARINLGPPAKHRKLLMSRCECARRANIGYARRDRRQMKTARRGNSRRSGRLDVGHLSPIVAPPSTEQLAFVLLAFHLLGGRVWGGLRLLTDELEVSSVGRVGAVEVGRVLEVRRLSELSKEDGLRSVLGPDWQLLLQPAATLLG